MRKLFNLSAIAAIAAIQLLVYPSVLHADSESPENTAESIAALRKQIAELDQKIRVLERKDELVKEESVKKLKESPVIKADSDGFSITSADKDFQLRIRGLFQFDNRSFITPSNPTDDGFQLRRLRPILQGTLFKNYEFRFEPEFGGATQVQATIQSAYVNVNYWKEAQVRVGRFKGPFGLERSQASDQTEFPEVGLPTNLTPNYDHGVLLHGNWEEGLFQYGVGAINGLVDNTSAGGLNDDEYNFVGSVFSHPFRATDIEELQGLGLGVATTIGGIRGAFGNYVTQGQQTFFSYRTTTQASGDAVRLSPNAYYYYGPFGFMTEYVVSSVDVSRTAAPFNRDTINNRAWQILACYVLTGEDASYKSVTPRKEFDWEKDSYGAWEVIARYGELKVDDAAFSGGATSFGTGADRARSFGVGLNWFINKNVKAQLAYDHTDFDGGINTTVTQDSENVITSRLQLAF